jgi:excisionase family DNA binding protein
VKRGISTATERAVAAPLVTHSDALPAGHGILTKPELAKHLKVSIRTITEMMKRGELAYIKINGRLVRFRLEDVHARLTETCLVCKALPKATTAKEAA